MKNTKIIRNMAKCEICGDIIESTYVHDYVECSCGNIFVDGGHDYLRRGAIDLTMMKDLSICEHVDTEND